MRPIARALLAAAAGCLLASGPLATANAQGDVDKRIDRLEKEIHELRSIVFQGRDTGQPVVVKPEGPDPAVEALQGRADAQDQAIRPLNGRLEVLEHELDEAKRQVAADHDALSELRGELKVVSDQLAKFQTPPQPESPPPPPPPPDQTQPQPPAPTASANEAGAFRDAKSKLAAADFAGASDAFNVYLQQYGSSPHAREAYYLLGESYFGRSQYGDATVAYARALKDWPKTAWAADATIKLSRALVSTNRLDQACAALGEFDKRYAALATKAVKAKAAATATAAKCAG